MSKKEEYSVIIFDDKLFQNIYKEENNHDWVGIPGIFDLIGDFETIEIDQYGLNGILEFNEEIQKQIKMKKAGDQFDVKEKEFIKIHASICEQPSSFDVVKKLMEESIQTTTINPLSGYFMGARHVRIRDIYEKDGKLCIGLYLSSRLKTDESHNIANIRTFLRLWTSNFMKMPHFVFLCSHSGHTSLINKFND